MQLQFLALVELFFKQLNGLQFLTRVELLLFLICSFPSRGLSRPHFVTMKGTFNHCGRSKAWNSTHLGRYVFQTAFFVRNMDTDMCIFTHTNMYTYTYKNTCTCTCACTQLGGWAWCGVVEVSLSLVLPASYDECVATGKSGAFSDRA